MTFPYSPALIPDEMGELVRALRVEFCAVKRALDTIESRKTPTLINGWTDGASPNRPCRYWLDPLGNVNLEGSLATGVSGTVAFVLPERYWPIGGSVVLNLRGTTNNFLLIDVTGNVTPVTNVTNTSLDGLFFRP